MEKGAIKIGVIGAGSVGLVFSVLLLEKGYDVEVVGKRKNYIETDNNIVCDIKGDFGNNCCLVDCLGALSEFTSQKDIIIVSTKMYDAVQGAKQAMQFLKEDGAIVTIQNMFNIDEIMGAIPHKNSVCAHLDFSCAKNNNSIHVKDNAGLTLGIYSQEAYGALQLVENVFGNIVETRLTNDIFGFVLSRNIVNAGISALGAISGLTLGEILNDRNGRYLFVKMIFEGVKVFQKAKINILPYNNQLDYYLFVKNNFKSKLYRYKILRALMLNHRKLRSSACIDLQNNRPTELKYILVKLIKFAEKHDVNIAYTNAICEMVKEIEKGERRIDKNAFYDQKLLEIGRNYDNRRN